MSDISEQTSKPSYHPDFNDPEADIILCSTEGDLFRVHALILKTASGFFRTMLSLPQNVPKDIDGACAEPEAIPVNEPKRVLEVLLRIISSLGFDPILLIPTLDDIIALLYAAEKLDLQGALAYLRTAVMAPRFLEDPIRVYSICVQYNWKAEARHCAMLTLPLDFYQEEHCKKLENLDGRMLMALFKMRQRRKDDLREELDSYTFHRYESPDECDYCGMAPQNDAWDGVKLLILDEFDKDATGGSIKQIAFFENKAAQKMFNLVCRDRGPYYPCHREGSFFDKDTFVQIILETIRDLSLELCI